MRNLKVILAVIGIAFALTSGCVRNPDAIPKKFVKLDAPLENVLSKITLSTHDVAVGDTYTGTIIPPDSEGESDRIEYTFLKQYAVEGTRSIFAIVAYNAGGSGVFHYLTAVDKTTLKSTDEIFLDDRPKIVQVLLTDPKIDTVSVTYIKREGVEYPPKNTIQQHFIVKQGKLQEVSR